jgi:hypothetical protein
MSPLISSSPVLPWDDPDIASGASVRPCLRCFPSMPSVARQSGLRLRADIRQPDDDAVLRLPFALPAHVRARLVVRVLRADESGFGVLR